MLPMNKLRILGHTVAVSEVDKGLGHDRLGLHDSETLEIKLAKDLPVQQQAATLLHEAVHAIDSLLQLGLTEHQVAAVAQGLYAVLRDNAAFYVMLPADDAGEDAPKT